MIRDPTSSTDDDIHAVGRRILIVEDEPLVALDIEEMLRDLGYEVAATAVSLADAFDKADAVQFDAAVIDVYLREQPSFELVERLLQRSIPVVLATGSRAVDLPDRFRDRRRIGKPFTAQELGDELTTAMTRSWAS